MLLSISSALACGSIEGMGACLLEQSAWAAGQTKVPAGSDLSLRAGRVSKPALTLLVVLLSVASQPTRPQPKPSQAPKPSAPGPTINTLIEWRSHGGGGNEEDLQGWPVASSARFRVDSFAPSHTIIIIAVIVGIGYVAHTHPGRRPLVPPCLRLLRCAGEACQLGSAFALFESMIH